MSADLGGPPKLRSFDECRDVYDWLEHVRLRPGMYVRDGSLQELGLLLFGYQVALQLHGVDEEFELQPSGGPFAQWLS